MIRGFKYQCPNCGTMTNYKRCPKCGNETDETDPRADPLDDTETGGAYTIFDHAQGVKPGTRSTVSQEKP